MNVYSWLTLIMITILFQGCDSDKVDFSNSTIVPMPKSIELSSGQISLARKIIPSTDSKQLQNIVNLIQRETSKLFDNIDFQKGQDPIILVLDEDKTLSAEAYTLDIKKDSIIIRASEGTGYLRAASTLLQMPDSDGKLKLGSINDGPDHEYRGLMIDCSRSWYSIASIKQIIDLCFWYKIKYLHLHLTDDGLFTFPSTAFPNLSSEQSYTLEEIEELNQYASERGCILIPEIDMPGHSSVFVSKYPKTFALKEKDQNYWTINMGKKSAYEAISILLNEVAESFPNSPYIHIGGDEVNFNGMKNDPHIISYMAENKISTFDDLYHHFITKVSRMVLRTGKTPMIWSDFTNKGDIKVPNDVVVMVWKSGAYHPDDLVRDGFEIINASWQPLYVVNNRKWSASEIYNWSPREWRSSQTPKNQSGIKMKSNNSLIGSSMSAWEQNEYKSIISLRKRLPAMGERSWNSDYIDFLSFENRLNHSNKRLTKFLYGFQLIEDGLTYPDWKDSNFSEHMWFHDKLSISADYQNDKIKVGYHFFDKTNKKREIPSIDQLIPLDSDLTISEGTTMMFQAYRLEEGKRMTIGHPIFKNYSLHPIHVKTDKLIDNYLPHNWTHHKFVDSLEVVLSSKIKGDIYYTTDDSSPTNHSQKYTKPFYLKENAHLRARLYSKNTDEIIGNGFHQEYVKIGQETSLTTGKPIITSNGELELSNLSYINDGQIARWDHWGDHTDGDNWIMVDLGKEEEISRFKTYTFWDDYRYYGYSIEVSKNKTDWKMVVDKSNNTSISVPEGSEDKINPVSARYLKLNMIKNSANPGLHLVEFNAFK